MFEKTIDPFLRMEATVHEAGEAPRLGRGHRVRARVEDRGPDREAGQQDEVEAEARGLEEGVEAEQRLQGGLVEEGERGHQAQPDPGHGQAGHRGCLHSPGQLSALSPGSGIITLFGHCNVCLLVSASRNRYSVFGSKNHFKYELTRTRTF